MSAELKEYIVPKCVYTVFFIDDDENLLSLVQAKLKKDFTVKTFSDPFECMDEAELNPPNLIVVDLNMPNIDGFEVLKQLKNHPATTVIPIVCTSFSKKVSDRNRVERLGAVSFLSKPYNLKNLSQDIYSIISGVNKESHSLDKRVDTTICFNEQEKQRLLLERTQELVVLGTKVLLITWARGEDLVVNNPLLEQALDSNQLVVLEINPGLITKIPYLQDFSPIIEDIKMLAAQSNFNEHHLIFDNFQSLFDYNEHERAITGTLSISKIFNITFKSSSFFLTRFHDVSENGTLLKVNNILIKRGF